ncbi:MAG: type IV secretion protein IcmX [Tatlockia sp.]|nr:type IV secretion protein IcmX [Tatlockia sp.]
MMKGIGQRFILASALMLTVATNFASVPDSTDSAGETTANSNGNLSDLINYFLNFGNYLGYNLRTDPSDSGKNKISDELLSPTPGRDQTGVPTIQLLNNIVFNSFLGGSFIVNTVPSIAQIVSNAAGNDYSSYINRFASYSFNPAGLLKQGSYATPNSPAGVSVSTLIDQIPYQADPVDQAVLNMLGTPDYSYCMDNPEQIYKCNANQEGGNNSTNILNEYQVMANVIGTPLPGTDEYWSFKQIKPLLGQLNVNSLITPLLYSNTALQQDNGGGGGDEGSAKNGLQAMSQTQQAANFIRYATAAVAPLVMPDRNVINNWVSIANQPRSVAQQQAQAVIANYLTSLRVYASQVSVGVSNLYFIMSKRMPQGDQAQTSQALSEFNMASWRLFNPNQTTEKSQWISQINKASSATIQKEMAVLLAEINYQLYLNRQQEERILLTNSLMLLQNSKASQPNSQLNPPITGVAGTNQGTM